MAPFKSTGSKVCKTINGTRITKVTMDDLTILKISIILLCKSEERPHQQINKWQVNG
jgi:hypothetical protein